MGLGMGLGPGVGPGAAAGSKTPAEGKYTWDPPTHVNGVDTSTVLVGPVMEIPSLAALTAVNGAGAPATSKLSLFPARSVAYSAESPEAIPTWTARMLVNSSVSARSSSGVIFSSVRAAANASFVGATTTRVPSGMEPTSTSFAAARAAESVVKSLPARTSWAGVQIGSSPMVTALTPDTKAARTTEPGRVSERATGG